MHATGAPLAIADQPFRSVTAEEVAHYKEYGWVKLEQFLAAPLVAALLAYAQERMGEDGSISTHPGKF